LIHACRWPVDFGRTPFPQCLPAYPQYFLTRCSAAKVGPSPTNRWCTSAKLSAQNQKPTYDSMWTRPAPLHGPQTWRPATAVGASAVRRSVFTWPLPPASGVPASIHAKLGCSLVLVDPGPFARFPWHPRPSMKPDIRDTNIVDIDSTLYLR
jgi:hypothetical protein